MQCEIACLPWQLQFAEAANDPGIVEVAALGSRGFGKTHALIDVNVSRALEAPGTDHIIFRRTHADIIQQYVPLVRKRLNNFGGARIPFAYNTQQKVFTVACPGGGYSRVILAFAETMKHAEKYQGPEYRTVSFDEITHFEQEIYQLITGSLRGGHVKVLVAGNPGGIGHRWVREYFIRQRRKTLKLITARLKDNLVLLEADPTYADRMTRGLPEWKKKQWVDGDWDAVEGAYFDIHPGLFREVDVPYYADWWACCDWGYYPSAFGVLWFATWTDLKGNPHCHVYRELKRYKLNLPDQAEEALDMEKLEIPRPVRARYCDPATDNKKPSEGLDTDRTVRQSWARFGWYCMPAKRQGRVPGLQILRHMMTPCYDLDTDPQAVLTIDPSCRAFKQELEDAQYETSSGVVSGDDMQGEDDLIDSFRYGIRSVYGAEFVEPAKEIEHVDWKKRFLLRAS